jgi:uncharacterized protein (TIGR02246 family)
MAIRCAYLRVFAVLSVVLAAACQQAPPEQKAAAPADPAPINALRDQFTAAYNSADAAALANLYTEDAIVMPPHQPAVEGKAAIQGWFQTFFSQNTAKLAIIAQETQMINGWAYDRGTFAITITPKAGGGPIEDAGKYLVILQRQADGAWKVHRDIDNSNNPLPAPPRAPGGKK